jgi:hypothetical protein
MEAQVQTEDVSEDGTYNRRQNSIVYSNIYTNDFLNQQGKKEESPRRYLNMGTQMLGSAS